MPDTTAVEMAADERDGVVGGADVVAFSTRSGSTASRPTADRPAGVEDGGLTRGGKTGYGAPGPLSGAT